MPIPTLLVPGSLVFRPTRGPVDLSDYRNWWHWTPGARGDRPEGPGSDVAGRDRHPVTHVAYEDADRLRRLGRQGAADRGRVGVRRARRARRRRLHLGRRVRAQGPDDGQHLAGRVPLAEPADRQVRGHLAGQGRSRPTATACSTWPATSGSGPRLLPAVASRGDDPRLLRPVRSAGQPARRDADGSFNVGQPGEQFPRMVVKGGSHLCAPNYCLRYRPAARQAADRRDIDGPPGLSLHREEAELEDRRGGTDGEAVQGHDQRRHPRLGARLGAVRAAEGARRCAERRLHRARRRRLLGDELLRRADRDAEHRPDRRRRRALHAVAHDGAVLADPLVPADRPQPHPQQHGLHHRGGDRVPERQRHDPAGERDAVGDPRRARLEHLHGRQVAPVPDRRDEPRLDPAQLAERPGLRALVRVPRRGDEPVVSRPRLRQPPGRPAASPEEGYHLTDDITDKAIEFIQDAKAIAPEKPFFLYYAPGACHAPHHAPKEWIDKFKGQFDMGYEAMREQTLARQKELGLVPGRHRAAADQPDRHARDPHRPGRPAVPGARLHPPVGLAERRREAPLRPDGRGLRRVPRRTPTTTSAGCSTTWSRPSSWRTRSSSSSPTTARAARAARTAPSTR